MQLQFCTFHSSKNSLPKQTGKNMKRILLVIPSSTYRTHDFMVAAQKINTELVVAVDHRQAMSALVPDTTVALNFRKPETLAEGIRAFVSRRGFAHPAFDAIIGVDDTAAYVAAILAQALHLPHNPVEAVRAARNKYFMRQKIAAAGLNYPFFQLFEAAGNPFAFAKRVNYPCVLKPIFLSGSRGVIRADDREAFVEAFEAVRALLNDSEVAAKAYADEANAVLVEDYVPGVEIALEGILNDGQLKTLAIFDKPDPLEGPHFVETIYVTPSRLPAYVLREVSFAAQRASVGMGLRNGPIHAEIRINEKGAYVIELAARSIGGLCSRVLRFNNGLTLEEVILKQALGEAIDDIQREHTAAAVMMIPVPKAGILKGVTGIEAARAVSGVEEVIISIPPDQPVEPLPKGGRYLGFIFARAEMPEDAEAALRKAYRHLQIQID
jgi:biotin carboxylase